MTNNDKYSVYGEITTSAASLVGFYSAILTTVLTIVTFGFAMIAIPISGANCPGDCVDYPYLDTASQYPKDFLWMPLAILLVLAYVTLVVSIHFCAPRQKKIFSQVGLSFALIAAGILVSDYYIQFSAIPMSLQDSESEGLAMLIQYNPHGVFIALEELGYLLMSLSFLFMAIAFAKKDRLDTAVRWVFIIGFILAIVLLAVISAIYRLERLDRFEVFFEQRFIALTI